MSRKVTRTMKCSKYIHSDGRIELVPVTMEKDNVDIIRALYGDGFVFVETVNARYSMAEDFFLSHAVCKELGDNLTDEEED